MKKNRTLRYQLLLLLFAIAVTWFCTSRSYASNSDLIPEKAFYKDKTLTEYTIPQGTVKIEAFAFARSALTSIVIPEGVEEIGYGAFYHCDNLENVVIPESVKTISAYAFDNTKWMSSWLDQKEESNFRIVGDGILLAYKGKEKKVTVPDGVKSIAPHAFYNNLSIKKAILPVSLLDIGEEAFTGCNYLKKVEGANKLMYIRDRAFSGCPLETIRIPDTVVSIGRAAFDPSGSQNEDKTVPIVFLGKNLPNVSNEPTAGRLQNAKYRDLALKGVNVAVIDPSIENLDGTILAKDGAGFRGLVCTIQTKPQRKTPGALQIRQCSTVPNVNGSIVLPTKVKLYDKEYDITDVTSAKTLATSDSPGSADQIQLNLDSFYIQKPGLVKTEWIDFVPEDLSEQFVFNIAESEDATAVIKEVCLAEHKDSDQTKYLAFSCSLIEQTSQIAIDDLGSSAVLLRIPLTSYMTGTPTVYLLDQNKNKMTADYKVVNADSSVCLEFTLKKIPAYLGICTAVTSQNVQSAVVKNQEAVFVE